MCKGLVETLVQIYHQQYGVVANIIRPFNVYGPGMQRADYPDTYPADEPNRRCPDISKAPSQLSYAPRTGLNEELSLFLGWAGEFSQ
jgi:nucleoside-diphosphate-sugar epimerase